ncbi:MAG: hypothetical protein AAF357_10750, partial [Verrucomicrobiota bacterium]
MSTILFRPFDIGKWFVLGFSAFLAAFLRGSTGSSFNFNSPGGGGGSGSSTGEDFPTDPREFFEEAWSTALTWIADNQWVIWVSIVVIVVLIAIGIVLLWLGARGTFMFLDNIVHNRAQVSQPWTAYKREANSLFVWYLIFSIVVGLLGLLLLAATAAGVYFTADFSAETWVQSTPITIAVIGIVLLIALGLTTSYITTLLLNAVVPVMYKHRLTAREGWTRFLALHRQRVWAFIGFFLWNALLNLAAAIVIMVAGFINCCICFLLFA